MATGTKAKQPAVPAAVFAPIEACAAAYAEKKNTLAGFVSALQAELNEVQRGALDRIRQAAAEALDARSNLEAALNANKGLFESPRTRTFSGVKAGFRKLAGTIGWDDTLKVVKRIRRIFTKAKAKQLIIVTEKPSKDELAKLPAKLLKRLGCTVSADSDVVVISHPDDEIQKLVDALLETGKSEASK